MAGGPASSSRRTSTAPSKCFRKFLNAGAVYGADVLVLGGDVAGKAIQAIVRGDGRPLALPLHRDRPRHRGRPRARGARAADRRSRLLPVPRRARRARARQADGTLDPLFLELMQARLTAWLALADERLRPTGTPPLFMLGNDDPPELGALLDAAPWGTHAEGRVVELDDGHEMISLGLLEPDARGTATASRPRTQLAAALRRHGRPAPRSGAGRRQRPRPAVRHRGLDEAPVLDAELRVQAVARARSSSAPVGSTAVRDSLERQPLLACTATSTSRPGSAASDGRSPSTPAATTAPERSTARW